MRQLEDDKKKIVKANKHQLGKLLTTRADSEVDR